MPPPDDKVLRPLPGPENLAAFRQTKSRLLGSTEWAALETTANGAIQSSLLTTRGDMLRKGATDVERFALGAQNTLLTAGADDPAWATLSTLLDAVVGSGRGTLIHRGETTWGALAPGADGTFLKSNGTGADLSWAAAGDLQDDYWQDNTATAITSSAIPIDNTIPQNGEGTEVWSQAITPVSASSKILVSVNINAFATSTLTSISALFTSASADAVRSNIRSFPAGSGGEIAFDHFFDSWGMTERTLSLRIGVNTSTLTLNSISGFDLGDTIFSTVRWREYFPPT